MDEKAQAGPEPAHDHEPQADLAAALHGGKPEPPAADGGDSPLSPAGVQRGLGLWLLLLLAGGGVTLILGHTEGAALIAVAGLFALAQASDAAAAFAVYRDWVHRDFPRRSFVGILVRTLVRAIVPVAGALMYLGLAAFALQDSPGANQKLAALWCRGAAVVCLALAWRPLADTITRLLFRGGSPGRDVGRTRRLTARVFVIAMLAPVPAQLLLHDLLRTLKDSGTALADPGALLAQLAGEVLIALAGVGLFVRRDLRATLERLGLTRMSGRDLAIAAAGFAAAFGVNGGMEWIERTYLPGLYATDSEATKLIAANLSVMASIVLGVSAGAGEEITVRCALQPRLGIVLSAILFAAGHLQYTWFGMLTIALLGVVLGLIRSRANTTTAILVHSSYDLVAALTAGH